MMLIRRGRGSSGRHDDDANVHKYVDRDDDVYTSRAWIVTIPRRLSLERRGRESRRRREDDDDASNAMVAAMHRNVPHMVVAMYCDGSHMVVAMSRISFYMVVAMISNKFPYGCSHMTRVLRDRSTPIQQVDDYARCRLKPYADVTQDESELSRFSGRVP